MRAFARWLIAPLIAVMALPLTQQPAGADEVLIRSGQIDALSRAPSGDTMLVRFNTTLYSRAADGWTRGVIDWAGPFYEAIDLTMTAADDGWTVLHGSEPGDRIAHWNGTTWEDATPPALDDPKFFLNNLSASAPDNVWVLASQQTDAGEDGVFIQRWDGTRWHTVPPPPEKYFGYTLTTAGPDDTWFQGDSNAWRWNGESWRELGAGRAPAFMNGDEGWSGAPGGFSHWDGSTWTTYNGPADVSYYRGVMDVTADGDVWFASQKPQFDYIPRIIYYSAGEWTAVDPPVELCGAGARLKLNDIDARTSSDVVVGGACVHRHGTPEWGDDQYYTIVAHYDGQTWTRI